jgi:predicted aspartyl protease
VIFRLRCGKLLDVIHGHDYLAGMGHVYLVAHVENPVEKVSREYRFMVDTGASYMTLREQP